MPAIGDSIDDGDFIGASIDEGFGGGGGGGFPTKTVSAPPRPTAAVKESVSAALISFDEVGRRRWCKLDPGLKAHPPRFQIKGSTR